MYVVELMHILIFPVVIWNHLLGSFSLGRLPYPGVNNVDVISFLKSGKRLEQPELCPSKM